MTWIFDKHFLELQIQTMPQNYAQLGLFSGKSQQPTSGLKIRPSGQYSGVAWPSRKPCYVNQSVTHKQVRTCELISVIWSVYGICLYRKQSRFRFFFKDFRRTCTTCFEVPSNTRNMLPHSSLDIRDVPTLDGLDIRPFLYPVSNRILETDLIKDNKTI